MGATVVAATGVAVFLAAVATVVAATTVAVEVHCLVFIPCVEGV